MGGDSNGDAGMDQPDALPDAFPANTNIWQSCPPNSALCFQLCGSPTCALPDNSIPANLATPGIMLPDGGVTASPCDAIEAVSMQIRERSCGVCHGPSGPPAAVYNWVLNDHDLVTKAGSLGSPLVIPGDPESSRLIQLVQSRFGGAQTGMPLNSSQAATIVGSTVANTIQYPTPEDLSVLSAWILNCVEGADGGAYTTSYYGDFYGPGTDAGAAAAAQTTGVDAGAPKVGDAGHEQ